MSLFAKVALGAALAISLSPADAVAEPISDPLQFCQTVMDAVAEGDANKATEVTMANEPDTKREGGVRAAVEKLVAVTTIFNQDGGVKFSDTLQERRLGKSIALVYSFYLIGKTDVFIRCEVHDSGSGWLFNRMNIETDIDRILPP